MMEFSIRTSQPFKILVLMVSGLCDKMKKLNSYDSIYEFQVNPALAEKFEEKGMMFVGRSEDGERMEIMELKGTVIL